MTGTGAGSRRRLGSASALLLGTLTSNLLAYAFLLILTRHLSEAEFGAMGTIVNLATIFSVASLGLQLVGARMVANSVAGGDESLLRGIDAKVMRLGWETGLVALLVLAVLAPLLGALLHIEAVTLLVLALSLVPATVTASVQGVLQGEERFRHLALLLGLAGFMKFAAALGALALNLEVHGVTVLLTGGWLVVMIVGLSMLPRHRRVPARRAPKDLWPKVAAAIVPTSGLLVLTSLDVLVARSRLPLDQSGHYAVGAIFEKAAFWGLSFIATYFYPRMAVARHRSAALARACFVAATAGAVGLGGAILLAPQLVALVGGDRYGGLTAEVWIFTALGVSLAFVQLFTYLALAAERRWVGIAVWLTAATAAVCAQFVPRTTTAVVAVMLVAVLALVIVLATTELLRRPTKPRAVAPRGRAV